MIEYLSENIDLPCIDNEIVTVWVCAVLDYYSKQLGDICYIFCDDDYILDINKKYLDHDYYTDIITFDYCEDDVVSGDLFISIDTVKSNAHKFNQEFEHELLRVVIHGILHLCDINDKSDQEAKMMRAAEDNALKILKRIKNEA